jgi:hypothetical protein
MQKPIKFQHRIKNNNKSFFVSYFIGFVFERTQNFQKHFLKKNQKQQKENFTKRIVFFFF